MSTIKPIKLDADAAKAFDELLKEKSAVSRMRKHEDRVKALKAQLKGVFGEQRFGELPDGRIVHRKTTKQSKRSQPAKTIEWDDFAIVQK